MFCDGCGRRLEDGAKFCPNCGRSVEATSAPEWRPPARIEASPGRWISEGWDIVKANLGTYIVIALIFAVLNSVPLIQGALIVGFHIHTMKVILGRRARISDLFRGFDFFLHSLLATIVIGVFTFFGTIALIIPGLVIAAMYKFTFLFMFDRKMDFWEAMKASHAVARNDYFGFTMFLIVSFLVNVLGAMCFFVGLLVTVPLTFAAITIAYKELVGFRPETVREFES